MRWRATRIAALVGATALLACEGEPPVLPTPPPELRAPPPCEQIAMIAVKKRDRNLIAFCEGGAVVELPVALGRGSRGPKRLVGDERTPEGRYQISGPPRRSRFHVFLPIDYPSISDAELALAEGRVSELDYHRILDAHAHRLPPPADTALGGYIGIHGEGTRWRGESRDLDWTFGCVGLSDADIEFLAERIAVGTPVLIEP
jgi:murein L,D-transpeptidase YafK